MTLPSAVNSDVALSEVSDSAIDFEAMDWCLEGMFVFFSAARISYNSVLRICTSTFA